MKMVELLSPAGSYEAFEAAIAAGADAVYVGGNKFGARAYAENFSQEELIRAIEYAHLYQRKLYLTLNTLCKEREFHELYDFLDPLYAAGLDAVIVQDLGIINMITEYFPGLEVHASTQMTLTGVEGAKYLKNMGATRIVTARELSLQEIKKIHENVDIEIESFIHGAMCYSYSGQCLFSSILGGRSGNRGRCAQPCRLPYDVFKGDTHLNKTNENYILSMKDLCSIEILPEILEAGVCSLKIEGRMKKPEYTANVTAIYRKYIDLYLKYGKQEYKVSKKDLEKLTKLYQRTEAETGYYQKHNGRELITLNKPSYTSQIEGNTVPCMEKIPVEGICELRKNEKAVLKLKYQGQEILTTGVNCEQAQKRPLLEEDVRKQLEKTGNISFRFETLSIHMDSDIFIPVKELNSLRRDAFDKLQAVILDQYRRESMLDKIKNITCEKKKLENFEHSKNPPFLTVLCETRQQLEVICELYKSNTINATECKRIYLDVNLFLEAEENGLKEVEQAVKLLNQNKIEIFIALPFIFRDKTRALCQNYLEKQVSAELFEIITGFLIRNHEELYFCKSLYPSKEMISDFNVYAFNQKAKNHLFEEGIREITIPVELNEYEMVELGTQQGELIVYGYLPMMISAGCIRKTLNSCNHKNSCDWYIRDRYQKNMRVLESCRFCYNRIMNALPLSLHGEMKSLLKIGPESFRVQFSYEDKEETEAVLKAFCSLLHGKESNTLPKDFTKGHFKRGVE